MTGHLEYVAAGAPAATRWARASTSSRAGAAQTRWRTGSASYLSANDHRLHFTLDGREPARFRGTWPDGTVETFTAPPGPAAVRFTRGSP